MENLKLYNSLSKKKEEFKPIKDSEVGLYTCGPTVYNFAHIGNLRTYVFEDILKRVLMYNGYKVKHIMNITDVGHLTGDQDMGEDKLEKGAKREGVSAWDIAKKYEKAFKEDLEKLNILPPNKYTRATEYISQQIDLIKILEEKSFTYVISDGVYFDTSKFPEYNKLSHLKLEDLQEGARVEINEEKRNATDFALWKFSPEGEKRQMEWPSPWGIGFPGWHLECSAMSMAELGDQLDIHCGGIDHINVHHTNEIAQSEAATGKQFFNYWMHGAFLNIEGGKKMAKSDDNFLTLDKVFPEDPLVYRLMCLGTRYRKPMTWNETSMKNYKVALNNVRFGYWSIKEATPDFDFDKFEKRENDLGVKFKELIEFEEAVNDDMNMAVALSVMYNIAMFPSASNSVLSYEQKRYLLLKMDEIIGLDLKNLKKEDVDFGKEEIVELPEEVELLMAARVEAREDKDWTGSDSLRDKIEEMGYVVEDSKDGMRIYKR